MKSSTDKTGKLSTYVTVMLLSVIIIIIIAAMADDREQNFQSQLESTVQTNTTIQNEIVTLKEENYNLLQEKISLEEKLEENSQKLTLCSSFSEIIVLYNDGNVAEAKQKLEEIDKETLSDELKPLYDAVQTYIK